MSDPAKKELSERDICTKFITPALVAGNKWDQNQIREEVYFTKGRVLVRGQKSSRGEARRADYVLSYKPGIRLAVLEAKDNNHPVGGGMQQALEYAEPLDVPYPPGVKNYNKTKPIRIEEFEAERKWWSKPGQESKRKETEFAWRVSIADIAARGYNLDVKNPHTVDAAHRDPTELLAEYQKAQAAVAEVREKLRRELETALESRR